MRRALVFVERFVDPVILNSRGTGHCRVRWEVLRSGGRDCKLFLLGGHFFLFPPSLCCDFGRMHNEELQAFHQGIFLSLCPSATEIPIENDSMVHAQ